MKALILYLAIMTTPDGNTWEMDSGLTLEDCRAAIAEGWTAYYDGFDVLPVPDGAALQCIPEGREA